MRPALQASRGGERLAGAMVFLNMPAMPPPEAYIGSAAELFNDAGDLTSDSTREFAIGFHERIRCPGSKNKQDRKAH